MRFESHALRTTQVVDHEMRVCDMQTDLWCIRDPQMRTGCN